MGFVDPSVSDLEGGSQRREKWEVSSVVKKKWSGMVFTVVLIVLALASAACSGQEPNEAALMESEVVTRNITVYESPT